MPWWCQDGTCATWHGKVKNCMNDVIILGNFPEFAQIPVSWEDPIPHSPHDGNFSSLAANEGKGVLKLVLYLVNQDETLRCSPQFSITMARTTV
jgi:hypothetical protein